MPISTRLADRVRRQAARLVREAGRARSGRVDGVHQARVASRRLREMLALAASVTDGDARSLARDAKRVGRVLGPLRELDVSSTVWREPRYEVPWAPTLLTRLDRAVERERSRLVPQMRTTIDRLAGARLLHRADTLASALVAANGDKAISAALVRSIRARSRALERAIDAAGTVYAHEALHEVRIAAKKFRYSLELVGGLSKLRTAVALRHLKVQQDLLGRLHDLQVVQDRVQALATEPGVTRGILRAIKAAAADLERECRALHAEFVSGVARLRELVVSLRTRVELENVHPRPGRMSTRSDPARLDRLRRRLTRASDE